jgi:hypothetical protein
MGWSRSSSRSEESRALLASLESFAMGLITGLFGVGLLLDVIPGNRGLVPIAFLGAGCCLYVGVAGVVRYLRKPRIR